MSGRRFLAAGATSGALAGIVAFAILIVAGDPSPAEAVADRDCGDFSNQAQAQSFFEDAGPGDPHGLDGDGNGRACESLPCPCAGSGGSKQPAHPACRRPDKTIRVTFSWDDYPNIIRHIKHSWRLGYPRKLVIWRKGADARRDALLEDIPTKRGFDRDEAPAAVLRRKVRASVRYVPSGENRSAGASLGNQIGPFCNGVRVRYRFVR